jgi:hypothetical protein
MSGATLPLLQYAFMAWCSFKAQGQLHLYLTFTDHAVFSILLRLGNSPPQSFVVEIHSVYILLVRERERERERETWTKFLTGKTIIVVHIFKL